MLLVWVDVELLSWAVVGMGEDTNAEARRSIMTTNKKMSDFRCIG